MRPVYYSTRGIASRTLYDFDLSKNVARNHKTLIFNIDLCDIGNAEGETALVSFFCTC